MYTYYKFYKPFGCLSQFTREHPSHVTLADFCEGLPKDVYAVGRLDKDSEGLLLLTNDKKINQALLHPKNKHSRIYWAQVEGIPTPEAIDQLQKGIEIKLKKTTHLTLPCKAKLIDNQPVVPERNPPIRFRKSVPDSWIELQLTEGKNRQVRKMCAKVGFPVLRLIRVSIEGIEVGDMQPGDLVEIEREEFLKQLKLL